LLDNNRVNSDSVVIYGCGQGAFDLLTLIGNMDIGVKIDCICDSDPEKQGRVIYGYPVISLRELSVKYYKSDIIISSTDYQDEIIQIVINMGFNSS